MRLTPGDLAKVHNIAREVQQSRAHVNLARVVADNMNARPRESFDLLSSHLAYAYAQGLVRGWRGREQFKGSELPGPLMEHE